MLMDTVFKNIKTLVNGSVVKFTKTAKEYETLESIENADRYIAAVQKTDRFDLYTEFDLEAIINARITTNTDEQIKYASDPSSIPYQFRDTVLNAQRQFIIDNYVEINNYYRMFHGLPNIEDDETSFFKLTATEMNQYEIFDDVFLHQLSDIDIYKLQVDGYIDKLISDNPDKKYLQFLGINKIDYITSRSASNFSLLKVTYSDIPDDFYNTFLQIYNQNREYFMSVLYISNYSNSYDLYDNFIALNIMLMTIQRVLSNTFKFGIQREFYDWSFIQNMYKSYNVPFIESLPIEYHVILLKNLNNLLRYKSTDKVLFDIASLLGYERLNIFKYYLIKKHRLDSNEEPIFKYKQKVDEFGELEYDEEGNPIYVEDLERMYELYFQRVNIKERNIGLALEDADNKLDYDEVTRDDPYWWEDADLSEIKYTSTYNYVETKYLSLNLMYKMTEMLFEITYAFRMIIDKNEDVKNFTISIPKINSDVSFNIFEITVFLVSLLCKKHGFKPGIVTTPSMISHIYGFNFNPETIEYIKKIITDNSKIIDQETLNYFRNLEINYPEDVNNLFVKIREFNTFIIDKMRKSNNIKEYHIYKDIFTISMMSETQTDMFNISVYDEEADTETVRPAKTYLEFLEHKQPVLAEVVNNTPVENISELIEHIISQLNYFMEDMQYMFILNDGNNPVFNAIIALIKFFKSYTVDLSSFNILYLFDSKYYNMIKMVEDYHLSKYLVYNEENNFHYSDNIKSFSENFTFDGDIFKIKDFYLLNTILNVNDPILYIDIIYAIYNAMQYNDNIYDREHLHIISNKEVRDILNVIEKYSIHAKNTLSDKLSLKDIIDFVYKYIQNDEKIYDKEYIHLISNKEIHDILNVIEKYSFHAKNTLPDNLNINDFVHISNHMTQNEYKIIHDAVYNIISDKELHDLLKIRESININNHFTIPEPLEMKNIISFVNKIKASENEIGQDMVFQVESEKEIKNKLHIRDKVILSYED